MTDQLIAAWIAAADDDFGGSLDFDPDKPRHVGKRRTPRSGVPYVYEFGDGYQVRIPGIKTRVWHERTPATLEAAREYVSMHVELER